ncbi:MAG: DUF3332 family protein [Planctomycetota bacterium]|nr:MAG: DUF3332 family protein [Planctomycetota bacterium]
MSKNRITRGLLCALALGALSTSCIGPFNTTRRIHTWNREIEHRWVGEGVFLIFRALPVYSVAFLADVIVLNAFDFWGGEHPIDPPSPERLQALADADDARAAE